jgi:hypothetical protein
MEIKMNNTIRYHVIRDNVGDGVLIFDGYTGANMRPDCWIDLSAYYNYLVARGQIDQSQQLLAEAMAGNRPITKMLSGADTMDISFG